MVIPTTYGAALALALLSMLCWGSWANTFKLTGGKWRFELFYFDYAFGVLLTAIIAAFTFGQYGTELTFQDNLAIASKRAMAYAFTAGVVFNLANMLLVGAIAIAGMAVAFPIGIGLALVIGVIWNYTINPQGNPTLLGVGVLLVVAAIIVDAMAFSAHRRSVAANQGKKSRSHTKGIVISLLSGVLMGSFYPLVEMSRVGEVGLGAYSVAVCFGAGVLLSTWIFNIYFMNLPLHGKPVDFGEYWKGTRKEHLLGLIGGALWSIGAITNFVAASAPKTVQVGPAVSYALGQGATLVSALWGLFYWKEFAGADAKVRTLLGLMLVLFVCGLAAVSLAPLYVR
ncbi:MAG: hypothetical protein HY820_40440 [Acidobacteria bacterium]|nr:hypothetical protein [Acidobacteriota bacterium]